MTKSHFVILVHGGRAPLLLGPMLEEVRTPCLRELRRRYRDSGLHALDVTARSPDRVSVRVKRFEPEGDQTA